MIEMGPLVEEHSTGKCLWCGLNVVRYVYLENAHLTWSGKDVKAGDISEWVHEVDGEEYEWCRLYQAKPAHGSEKKSKGE